MVKKTIKLFGTIIHPYKIKSFGEKEMKVKVKTSKNKKNDEVLPRELPPELIKSVEFLSGRSKAVFLARKELEELGTKQNLNRLFVPRTPALIESLTEGEKNVLGMEKNGKKRKREKDNEKENEKKKKKKREGVEVAAVDPEGRIYNKMSFKKWPSLNQPVLVTEWIKLVKANGLEKEDSVEIWSFRAHDNKLCFAVNIVRKREN